MRRRADVRDGLYDQVADRERAWLVSIAARLGVKAEQLDGLQLDRIEDREALLVPSYVLPSEVRRRVSSFYVRVWPNDRVAEVWL